jgi:hypothetical protein
MGKHGTSTEPARTRRALGLLVGATICATPLVAAPAALAGPVDGVDTLAVQTVTSTPNTLTHPLAGSSGDLPAGNDACENATLISPLLSCVIDSIADLLGGQATATTTKKSLKIKTRGMRKTLRAHRAH